MQKLLSIPFYQRLLLLLAALLLCLCAAWFFKGYEGELAKSNTDGTPTWDSINTPFIMAFLMRLMSAIFAFWAALAVFLAYQDDIKNELVRWLVLAAMLFCGLYYYYYAGFSSEGWMISFLLWMLTFLRREQFFAAVLLFFVALVVRRQMFILLPLAMYVLFILRLGILRPDVRNIALAVAGGVVALAAGFFIDWWFYGKPFLPEFNYLLYHTTGGEIKNPVSFFMYWLKGGEFMLSVGYLLPVILAVFWWKFPRHALTLATLLYVVFHLYTDFKELRYMYPFLVFMPFIAAFVWESVIQQREKPKHVFLWLLTISALINAPLLLFVVFYPAAEVKMLRQCILPKMEEENISTIYYLHDGKSEDNIDFPIYFHRVPNAPVDNESELAEKISTDKTALYVSRKPRDKQLQKNGLKYKQICSALPEWRQQYNFNNWTPQTSSYPVYQVSKS